MKDWLKKLAENEIFGRKSFSRTFKKFGTPKKIVKVFTEKLNENPQRNISKDANFTMIKLETLTYTITDHFLYKKKQHKEYTITNFTYTNIFDLLNNL